MFTTVETGGHLGDLWLPSSKAHGCISCIQADKAQLAIFDSLKMQCVLHWRTKIEEFLPMLHYIKGPRNILANNLSRLHRLLTPAQIVEGKKLVEPAEVSIEDKPIGPTAQKSVKGRLLCHL